jgi:multicomponent K+:H+ antiporter subunit E
MNTLKVVVPAPFLSAALLVLWMVIAGSASPGTIAIGLLLALSIPRVTMHVRSSTIRLRQPGVIARYMLTVAYDVIHSNVEVARDVLLLRRRHPHSQFVVIPLELREPVALAVLAMVTTVVPGTVWAELALDRSAMMLHVWNVGDEAAFVARFKERYEHPLREIFE